MANRKAPEEDFWRNLAVYEQEGLDAFLKASGQNLRDAIAYLILHRELLRDDEIARLESQSKKLLGRLRDKDQQKLVEEVACFKDILALQKRLLEENGAARH